MGVSLLIGNGLNRCNPNGGVSARKLVDAIERTRPFFDNRVIKVKLTNDGFSICGNARRF